MPTPRARFLFLVLTAAVAGCRDQIEPTAPVTGADLPISAAVDDSRTITLSPSDALNSTAASPFSVGTVTSPFGSGNFASQILTVANTGTRTTSGLTVTSLAAPFAVTGDQCTGRSLGVAGSKKSSCTLAVTFTPTATGTFTATLIISVAQPKTTLTVYLSGTAGDPTYSISGTVFVDANADGALNAPDTGAEGIQVTLKDQSGTTTIETTTSGSDGTYSFAGVASGSYKVAAVLPPPNILTSSNPVDVTVTSADVSNVNFGFFALGYAISGMVFADADHDGILDDGETGAGGVSVALKDQSGTTTLQTTTSESDGTYSFTGVGSGAYQVAVAVTVPNLVTTTNPRAVTVAYASVSDIDFGVAQYTLYGKAVYWTQICDPSNPPATGVQVIVLSRTSAGEWAIVGPATTGPDGYWGRFDPIDPSLEYGFGALAGSPVGTHFHPGPAPVDLSFYCTIPEP